MKMSAPLISLLLAALALAFLAGCATRAVASSEESLVQALLDKVLDPTWVGDADIERHDSYFDWHVTAGNLHRNQETGRWTWDWLVYERKSHFPLFSGLTWSSTGKVRLGSPPSAPK